MFPRNSNLLDRIYWSSNISIQYYKEINENLGNILDKLNTDSKRLDAEDITNKVIR